MKKIIFCISVNNVVDCITNSSSELFILKGETKDIVKEMISEQYPNYLNEYEELTSLYDMSNYEINEAISWLYSNHWAWNARTKESIMNKSSYQLINGLTFDEMYEFPNVDFDSFDGRSTWKYQAQLKNNSEELNEYGGRSNIFVCNENRDKVIKGIINDFGEYFLYSIDENPNWEYQEKLMNVGQRFHLG